MKKKHNRLKKTQSESHRYRNMVNYKTENDCTDNNTMFIEDLQGTNEITSDSNINENQDELKVQKAPIADRTKNFLAEHVIGIMFTIIVAIGSACIYLKVGQAVLEEKYKNIEEEVQEIKTLIDDKYIMKDVYNIEIDNLKDRINKIESELSNMKK